MISQVKRDMFQLVIGHGAVLELAPSQALMAAKTHAAMTGTSVAIKRKRDGWPVCRVQPDGRLVWF